MTSKLNKWLSALLAVLMVASPMAASLAEGAEQEIMVQEEHHSEPAPAVEPQSEPESEPSRSESGETQHEELIPEEEMEGAQDEPTEAPAEESPADGGEQAAPSEDEPTGDAPSGDAPSDEEDSESDASQQETGEEHPVVAEPVYATALDASSIISPIYVPYGAQEGELPLPASLPASFSDGSTQSVSVMWFCTGNTYDGKGYIPECEDRGAVFYFQATPVGVECSPSMLLPAVTVMYAQSPEAAFDHEAINFAGTDIIINQGATVSTDDILNEDGYDPSYRIVCEGIIESGESGAAIPNPVKLSGAIRGGTFDGAIELARGTIRGGTFNARIESARGTIHGGAFNGPIGGPERQIYVSIYGGTFRGDVGDSEYDGYIFIHGGEFYCNVQCRNLTVDGDSTFYNAEGEGGARKTVTLGTVGAIAGGVFYADVLNRNNILGGAFYGKVTNGGTRTNCNVLGGTFYGEFDNAVGGRVFDYGTGDYGGARFLGEAELNNSGEIDAGESVRFSDAMTINNESAGVIRSGAYPCKIVNYGTIVGGSFPGSVINRGRITGGVFDGELYNEGGTVAGATLNGMLMSNTGMVTLDGIVADPNAGTITIASGTSVTTDQILIAAGGDADGYVLHNEGEIAGGEAALSCDFASDSTGIISGGSFSGSVRAGAISGGSFSGPVRADSISDGEFSGRVIVRNSITGGSFGADSLVTAGVIAAGSFSGEITSAERELLGFITITGGTFTGGVATGADDGIVINGGTFNCPVGHCVDSACDIYDGYVIIRAKAGVAEPKFNGSYVGGHNVVIECGEFSEGTKVVIYSSGGPTGGTFRGPVICNNAIMGGTFYGDVTVNSKPNGQIHGGTFYGSVHNKEGAYISEDGYGGNPPPKFLGGEIVNEGVIDSGAGVEFGPELTIINEESGSIRGGVFNSPVRNYGSIARGTFNAPVTSYRPMAASAATFNEIVMDVPAQTLTIPADLRKSFAEIREMEGYAESTRIINQGVLYSEDGDALPNDVENRGAIESGSYSGAIKLVGMENKQLLENRGGRILGGAFSGTIHSYYGVISGGTFDGKIELDGSGTLVITITGGTFNESVGEPYNGYVFVYRADGRTIKYGAEQNLDDSGAEFNGPVAARNLNITCGTFNGPVEMSTVGIIENGLFRGEVTCHNIIAGGEFCEAVKVCSGQNSYISGGLFHKGTKVESGTSIKPAAGADGSAIAFDGGEIANEGTLDPGEGATFGEGVTVRNEVGGSILSGVYRGAMVNYGTISNAVLCGKVQNEGRIINSTVLGQISGDGSVSMEGVSLDGSTITIDSGYSISTDQIASLLGEDPSGYTVVNGGTITAGSASLACTIRGGRISGGSFTGTVYAASITGGTFDGPVCAKVIRGGTFNASVRDFTERSASGVSAPGMDYTGGLSIQDGTFNGSLGGANLDDAIFIHGGDFSECAGINAWNFTVDAKLTGSVTFGGPVRFTVGDIAGGTFEGAVTNGNKITGGVFEGRVINNGTIAAGTFNGGIENHGVVSAMESYNYAVAEYDSASGTWRVETRRQKLDGTFLNCDVENIDGGTVETGVTWGEGFGPSGSGATYAAAFIGNTDGTGRVYNGREFRFGQNIRASLASLDEAQSTKSEWTRLNGDAIGAGETISLDPMENLFLREPSFNIRDGVLELDQGWSAEGEEPNAIYSSVHIPSGATVSAGEWTRPVVNDGAITGGSFADITNRGTITGATINGSITAASGSIENCAFGSSARVASIGGGASILVSIDVGGESCAARYGSKLLDALNGIRVPGSGYEWYDTATQRAVSAGDVVALQGGSYDVRVCPAPAIIWPTDAAVGINCQLSTATFTDRDPNGSFSWANPSAIANQAGRQSFEMVYTPDPGNTYSYASVETRRSVPVEVVERVITVQVDSFTKQFGDADPTFTGTTLGLLDGENINRIFNRVKGEDVGSYQINADVRAYPAGCTVRVVPGTLTIEPRPLNAAVVSISEGGRKYYPNDRYAKSYTGAAIEPSVQVTFLGKALVEGKDYTRGYRDNVQPGTAYIEITGIGNYSGQVSRAFTIGAGKATLSIESCSKEFGAPDPELRATVSGVSDPSLVQYELYRMPGENVGTYSILARSLGGPFTLDISGGAILTITPKQLPANVTAPEAQTYTGAPLAPKPVVKDGAATLVEGKDYTLSYENNVNAGSATAIATGKGNYAGSQRASFAILPARAEIRVNSATKNLEEPDPAFSASVSGEVGGQRIQYSFERDPGEELGEYAIRAVPGENPNYEIATVPGTLTILPVVTRITLSQDALELDEGESQTLSYSFYPEVATAPVDFSVADRSVATVDQSGAVRAVQAGSTSVTATTDNGKSASCQIIVRPVARKLSLANGESARLSVSGRNVTSYESSNPSVAQVDAGGMVSAKQVGSALITASGDGLELAKWELSVTPAPTKVTISQESAELSEGQQIHLSARTDEGSNAISWSSSKAEVASVDGSGLVTAKMAGSAVITAKSYNGKTASCKISVIQAPTSIALSVTSAKLGAGDRLPITVTLSKGSDCEVRFESTNPEIATIRDGMIEAGIPGTATISASTYNGLTASCTVTVLPKPTAIDLGGDVTLGINQKLALPVKLEPSGALATIRFESSNGKVVSVSDAGELRAVSGGSAVITARTSTGLEASIQVTVQGAPRSVTISAKKASIGVGQTYQLTAESVGAVCELTWSSNKKGVADVDQNGLVTAYKTGTAKISATTYNNKKAVCTITVTKAPSSIKLNLHEVSLGVGERSDKLKATLSKKSTSEITYSFDRDGIAAVEDGRIVGKAPGVVTLTASTYNGLRATCSVAIMAAPTSIDLGPDQSLKVKKTLALKPAFGAGEGGKLTYSTSNKKIATVDANGKVKAKKAGIVTITATAYNGVSGSITITVTKK